MILDSSAVVAIVTEEQDGQWLLEALESTAVVGIGAPTLAELSIVLVRRFELVGRLILSRFVEANRVVTVPFDDRHWRVAAEAFIRYGKGRHPAGLNLGDCMTYATASVADQPLLFVGDDFSKTDVAVA